MTMKKTRRSQIPGSPMGPTDVELLNILGRRIKNGKRPSFVTDVEDLYEKKPWLLQHVQHFRYNRSEWFYFVARTKLAGFRKAETNRTSRNVVGAGGWKTTGKVEAIVNKHGIKVGSKQSISFQVTNRTEMMKTGWVMHEFLLNIRGFQRLGLCRVRFNPGKDNAQYAPTRPPILIGQPPVEYGLAPVVTPQQWNGSFSGEASPQQAFGSYGQQQNQSVTDMAEYQNPYLGHQMDPFSQVPYSAQPYDEGMMQHDEFSSSVHFMGESSSCHQQNQNLLQGIQCSLMAQQRCNVHSGSDSGQPYDQGMMGNLGSSTPCLAQNNQYVGPKNDLTMVPVETRQGKENEIDEQHFGQGSKLSASQEQNQVPGQALDEEQQCVDHTSPSLVQNNNSADESRKQKEEELDNLMNLGEEDWKRIMSVGDEVWNNLMSLNDFQDNSNVDESNEQKENDLEDLKNLGVEDCDYIESLGKHGWNNLINPYPP